ncbi:MAG: hypothetical protein QW161_06400 [Candidatus Bathyarchaeia archaeon]
MEEKASRSPSLAEKLNSQAERLERLALDIEAYSALIEKFTRILRGRR